jgi:hypothetical protein
MRWWRKTRAIDLLILVSILTILLLVLPISALTATPSPGGATLALAAMTALALPVSLGWAISRGDAELEHRAARPVASRDLGLVLALVVGVVTIEVVLHEAGLAYAGIVAARAAVTYTGMMLVAMPAVGWRNAAIVPAIYLTLVLVVGGGSDVENPAGWAWIAAMDTDSPAMGAAVATFLIGLIAHLRATQR